MRILLVEDDRKHREDLQRTLGRAKGPCPRCVLPITFEVETAETVEQARKQIVERGYEFVLIDVNISGNLEAEMLLPLLEELSIPHAFYAEDPDKVVSEEAPVWENVGHVRMDLVTKISDHYHSYMKSQKKQLSDSGRFCLGRAR